MLYTLINVYHSASPGHFSLPEMVLAIATEHIASEGCIVRWSSESNRFYTIWRSEGLCAGEWAQIQEAIPATPPEMYILMP